MNGECCFARAGSDCYAHWKAGKWNRACILSNINLHVPKLKQGSGILTLGARSICRAFCLPDPKEGLLCVLCAACVVSHLSPLKMTGKSLSHRFFSRGLQYSVWVFISQRPIGDDIRIPQLWVCLFLTHFSDLGFHAGADCVGIAVLCFPFILT